MASKDDGSFQVAVPPGKGHLMVLGPTLRLHPAGDRRRQAVRRRPARRSSLLRPRHHRLRGQGRRRTPRGHRDPQAGQDAARPRGRPGGRDGRGRGDPHPATARSHQPHVARPVRLHPRPRRPLRAARLRPGEGRAGATSSTPITAGVRGSSSPASRPARSSRSGSSRAARRRRGSSGPTASPSPGSTYGSTSRS